MKTIIKRNLGKSLLMGMLMFFLFIYESRAQIGFVIGPKGGVTVNSFYGDDAGNIKANVSGVGGLFANLSIAEVFSIQPELLLHQKGATQTVNNIQNKIRLNYFSLPVLLKLRLPIDGTFYPHIFAGPSFSYRINSKFTTTNTQDGTHVAFEAGDVKRNDVGGVVGAGIDIVSNKVFLNADIRYGMGFNDIGDGDNNLDIRTRHWGILLGIGYRIGTEK